MMKNLILEEACKVPFTTITCIIKKLASTETSLIFLPPVFHHKIQPFVAIVRQVSNKRINILPDLNLNCDLGIGAVLISPQDR